MMDKSNEPKRRARRSEVQLSRQAVAASNPVRERIGKWQLSAARLKMLYLYESDPAARSSVASEAYDLLQVVRTSHRELETDALELPPLVTHNSRFQDVVRALTSVTASLETFASPPGAPKQDA